MAYNKAKEERKWRLWKEAEEKKLRQLGVNEDTIEQLRVHDWAIFNSDRRYYQRMQEAGTYLEEIAESEMPPEIKTVDDFLDSIENQKLYQILIYHSFDMKHYHIGNLSFTAKPPYVLCSMLVVPLCEATICFTMRSPKP